MEASRSFKPDLVFVQTHQSDIITPHCYKALRDNGAFVVNWCGDVRYPLPMCYRRYADCVDVMAMSNMPDVDELKSNGYDSRYLQIGYDPDIYYPGDDMKLRSGIVFMANHYEGRFPNTGLRKEVAERLKAEFPDDFTLYGSGWKNGAIPLMPMDEADTYRRSLVAINVDHFTRPYFASDRILRAQACGCAVISWDYEGLREEHPLVGPADSIDRIVAMCKSALNEPHIAMKVGAGSAAHVAAHHQWTNRIETMTGWMS